MAINEPHLIWQNDDLDLDDWREDLLEDTPGLTEGQLYERMTELNNSYLENEQAKLGGIVLTEPILVIGDLGLWNGRRTGYKLISSGKLSHCLRFGRSCESGRWYVDGCGDFRGEFHHHDGTNRHLYRGVKDANSAALRRLLNQIADQKPINPGLLSRTTYRLGDLIGDVYGWKFRNPPKARLAEKGVA